MMVRKLKRFFLFTFVVFLIAVGFSLVKYFINQPPYAEIEMAKETLSKARKQSASNYASEKMAMADNYYKQTLAEWKIQNSKFFVFRNYDRTRDLALKSFSFAADADKEAGSTKTKLKNNIETKLNETNIKIERFKRLFKGLPLGISAMDLFNKGNMCYLEAIEEFENKDYKRALKSTYKAFDMISNAEKSAQLKLTGFFNSYSEWKRNINYAYELSKTVETVVLVNKMESTCKILKAGRDYKTFYAEFGINWMGDKLMYGDKATPEGIYRVIDKKSGVRTKYYKALLINYPNESDKARYYEAIRSGVLSKKTSIGSLIEIHGDGGRGINWTEGCVALENRLMDTVFDLCQINTPVIIVGSAKPIEEYFNL